MDKELIDLLDKVSKDKYLEAIRYFRRDLYLHPLEKDWNTKAETVLEAVYRAGDISKRGIKGLIAELIFGSHILPRLESWVPTELTSEVSYDYLISNGENRIKIQVKNQRSEKGAPLVKYEKRNKQGKTFHRVEVQRTRTGKDKETGEETRPYRFGDFDILAVCLYASTGEWDQFVYTLSKYLDPHKNNASYIATMQDIPMGEDLVNSDKWTTDLNTCVQWLIQNKQTTIENKLPLFE